MGFCNNIRPIFLLLCVRLGTGRLTRPKVKLFFLNPPANLGAVYVSLQRQNNELSPKGRCMHATENKTDDISHMQH
jgi:hypothetical protein